MAQTRRRRVDRRVLQAAKGLVSQRSRIPSGVRQSEPGSARAARAGVNMPSGGRIQPVRSLSTDADADTCARADADADADATNRPHWIRVHHRHPGGRALSTDVVEVIFDDLIFLGDSLIRVPGNRGVDQRSGLADMHRKAGTMPRRSKTGSQVCPIPPAPDPSPRP